MNRAITRIARFGLVALVPVLVACGDDEGSGTDSALFGDTTDFPDSDTGGTGTGQPDSGTGTTTADVATDSSVPPDLIPDLDPPMVISTTPTQGANGVTIPFIITLTFDEPVFEARVVAATETCNTTSVSFCLFDFDNKIIPATATLSADKLTVTIKPVTNDQVPASPYMLLQPANRLGDLAGNTATSDYELNFSTANWPAQAGYRALAEKYAPKIYSGVEDSPNAQSQIPTKFDSDGDWNLANTKDWLNGNATSVIPAVYYDVAETRTHYFIHYTLYFPWVDHPSPTFEFGNSLVGYMVTVQKAFGGATEVPLAVHTSFREGDSNETNMAFTTTESNIIGEGSATGWCAREEFDQAILFPNDRFEAFITPRTHRACIWAWENDGFAAACELTANIKDRNKLVFEYKGGAPTPVMKAGLNWPTDMSQVDGVDSFGYVLIPTLTTLWPRRFQDGAAQIFESGTSVFKYSADADRPGAGIELPGKLVDSVNVNASAFGRPLWTWGYVPGDGSCVLGSWNRISRGQMALDPAWYVWERHTRDSATNGLVEYDAQAKTGFSVDYCFNAFVGQDNRTTDPACQ
ncbi:MAG: hypothetical protein ACI9MR_002273 [Myxococcota bacterium]|jgi:hypothetical protein